MSNKAVVSLVVVSLVVSLSAASLATSRPAFRSLARAMRGEAVFRDRYRGDCRGLLGARRMSQPLRLMKKVQPPVHACLTVQRSDAAKIIPRGRVDQPFPLHEFRSDFVPVGTPEQSCPALCSQGTPGIECWAFIDLYT